MGSKGTTIKDALSKWEKKQAEKAQKAAENPDQMDMGGEAALKAADAKVVKLIFEMPPIEKMDASLSTLANCEQLSLSSNQIEKIANLNGLKNLKILCLARNQIKNLNGLDAVQETLQQLWISYNFIEKLKGIQALKKLQVLYMCNNSLKDWEEFNRLNQLPCLVELNVVGNPLEEKHSVDGDWSDMVKKKLPGLKKLDGVPIIHDNAEGDEDAD